MRKTFCVTPIHLYDRVGVAQWLDAKVAQGLFPTKIGMLTSVFTACTESDCKFYLEPRAWGQREPTLHENIDFQSWSYVCPVSGTYFLFSAKKSTPAPEDDGKLQRQIEAWRKSSKRGLLAAILLPVLVLMLGFGATFLLPASKYDIQPNAPAELPHMLLLLCNPLFALLFLFFIISGVFYYRDCRTVCAPSSVRWRRGVALVLSVVVLLSCISALLPLRDTSLEDFSQPYVTLSALEDVPITSRGNLYDTASFYGSEKEVQHVHSFLAPKAYVTTQRGYEATSTNDSLFSPEGAPAHYAPLLKTAYFELLLPALSRPIAESQMDSFRLVNLRWNYRELSYEGLDFVILAQAEGDVWQMAALGQGNRIVVLRYAGLQNLGDHLAAFAALVTS